MKIGKKLKLECFGESHAPAIGMRLEGMPAGLSIDLKALQSFMERRAPGRDPMSTARKEPDIPEFTGGVSRSGGILPPNEVITDGSPLEAVIRNTDTRSQDYEKTVPRPGHADYPNYLKIGRIPAGGGANSGRLTAAMCIAGGVCLQALERRGIAVKTELELPNDIMAAKAEGDSVGGIITATVTGLPVGLGGPMFDGIDGALAQAIFGIPGVKGIEFGTGFKSAYLKGSENNDAFEMKEGRVVTRTNNAGGVLGGMTSGMPLVFRVAMKPTPSIYLEQDSVDLKTKENVKFKVHGRHDPCIARRAMPVVEALAAFTVLDHLLEEESGVDFMPVNADELRNIVIDSEVARLYPHLAEKAIAVIPSGEEHKTIETIGYLWAQFARHGLGRKDHVTAIGGGVTGDLTGFAAATWMRGIDWVNVPTTLLAMVDASYGGKTACDLEIGKNMVGAFHPPRRVIIDVNFLKTLPKRRLADGRAEMIKHEIIGGLAHDGDVSGIPSAEEVKRNLQVKIDIVRRDPTEKIGERMKLNAGHTVAHAIEKATSYAVSHGEAVAIGCVEEAKKAVELGLADKSFPAEIAARFAAAGLPVELPEGMSFESLKPLMKGDKKREGDSVVFALPCGWGNVRGVKI